MGEVAAVLEAFEAVPESVLVFDEGELFLAFEAVDGDDVGAFVSAVAHELEDAEEIDGSSVAEGGEIPLALFAHGILESDEPDVLADFGESDFDDRLGIEEGEVPGVEGEFDGGVADILDGFGHRAMIDAESGEGIATVDHLLFGADVADLSEDLDELRAFFVVRRDTRGSGDEFNAESAGDFKLLEEDFAVFFVEGVATEDADGSELDAVFLEEGFDVLDVLNGGVFGEERLLSVVGFDSFGVDEEFDGIQADFLQMLDGSLGTETAETVGMASKLDAHEILVGESGGGGEAFTEEKAETGILPRAGGDDKRPMRKRGSGRK